MKQSKLPNIIYAGTAKSASTWIYEALSDHPNVFTPETDSVHFFDLNFHKGINWYSNHFTNISQEEHVIDMTPHYLHCDATAERIDATLDDVKIIFCFRNPVDRAYSHWWHTYNGPNNREFELALKVPDAYSSWVEPGFYSYHLDRYFNYFDQNQIEIFFFDDLVDDDLKFIQNIYQKIGVNSNYKPSNISQKRNTASHNYPEVIENMKNFVKKRSPEQINEFIRPVYDYILHASKDRDKYEEGMDEDMRKQLENMYLHDIQGLSERTNRDLDDWLEFHSVDDDEATVRPGYGI
jgi:hypothetical protein